MNAEKYGLDAKDFEYLIRTFDKISEIDKVILFGSRAIGNFKKGSDVDLAITGFKHDPKNIISKIKGELNEHAPLPYFFDVVNFDMIKADGLLKHINEFGIKIYP